MTKQHYPNSAGIKQIRSNSHALSNASGHTTAGYGAKLKAGGVNSWTGEQPQIAASPKVAIRANAKPLTGSQTSSKGGHK